MKQWAFTLPLILCIAATAGCSSDTKTTPPKNTGGAAGTGGGTAGTGAGGGSGSGSDETVLQIDPSGYMSMPSLGLQGAWYAYGDGINSVGMPPGDCQNAGHATADCSLIEAPMAGSFANVNGAMHTKGTVETVGNTTSGTMMCPATQADCDYTAMWGAGIGVDVNNAGNADGGTAMKMAWGAATSNKIVGIAFDIDMIPLPNLRVEFPMANPDTKDVAHVYSPTGGDFHSPLMPGHNRIMWTDLMQPSYVAAAQVVAFDPNQLVSVQFHVPTSTSTTGQIPYEFTISNFSVIKAP